MVGFLVEGEACAGPPGGEAAVDLDVPVGERQFPQLSLHGRNGMLLIHTAVGEEGLHEGVLELDGGRRSRGWWRR